MNRLSKFLMRFPKIGARPLNKPSRSTAGDPISKTINDALVSAGLLERRPIRGLDDGIVPVELQARITLTHALQGDLSPGKFVEYSYSHRVGTRQYKLYVPAGYNADAGAMLPLVVMLHGCTQTPDDFATGTGMNAMADRHGFFVAYPAQSPNANGSKCWNWFRPQDQAREGGEAALIAGLTRQVLSENAIDPQRVYVAGLSAGAAMAVILGTTYPELYKAVGAHSGLPYGAAHDIPSAFAAMSGRQGNSGANDRRPPLDKQINAPVTPIIIFHGDADRTVAPANGNALLKQALGPAGAQLPESRAAGTAVDGVTFTRSVYTTALGEPLVEYWEIHGGGHAWSGGCSDGSYTDPRGPDASAEMVRFFQETAKQE